MVCCATVNVVSSAPTSRRYYSPQPLHLTAQSSSSSILSPPKSTLFCRTFSPSLSHLPVQSSPLSSLRSSSELPSAVVSRSRAFVRHRLTARCVLQCGSINHCH